MYAPLGLAIDAMAPNRLKSIIFVKGRCEPSQRSADSTLPAAKPLATSAEWGNRSDHHSFLFRSQPQSKESHPATEVWKVHFWLFLIKIGYAVREVFSDCRRCVSYPGCHLTLGVDDACITRSMRVHLWKNGEPRTQYRLLDMQRAPRRMRSSETIVQKVHHTWPHTPWLPRCRWCRVQGSEHASLRKT